MDKQLVGSEMEKLITREQTIEANYLLETIFEEKRSMTEKEYRFLSRTIYEMREILDEVQDYVHEELLKYDR